MKQKCILFDLDGTLTDSGLGIINCALATFVKYAIPLPDRAEMRTMVGPPLRQSFVRYGIAPELVDEAVAYYRSLYNDTGKYENVPYPGITDLLKRLKADGHRLFVATSKPEHMSVDILQHFSMDHYFERICGSLLDGVRDKKEAVIAYLLDGIGCADNAVMVGDTVYDVLGANVHNIPTVAVSWGYGNCDEMVDAGAAAVVHTMDQLYDQLTRE